MFIPLKPSLLQKKSSARQFGTVINFFVSGARKISPHTILLEPFLFKPVKTQSRWLTDAGHSKKGYFQHYQHPFSTTALMPQVEQQPPPTKSLLSNLFVQPCHSLADPPPAQWMDMRGQYTNPACPLTAHTANNRGPCVLQIASQAR